MPQIYQQTPKGNNGDGVNFEPQNKNLTSSSNTGGKLTDEYIVTKKNENCVNKYINLTGEEESDLNAFNEMSDDNFDYMLYNLENEMQYHSRANTAACQLIPTLEKINNIKGNTGGLLKKRDSQVIRRIDIQQRHTRHFQSNNEENQFIPTVRPQIICRQLSNYPKLNTDHHIVSSGKKESDKNNCIINDMLLKLMCQSEYVVKPRARIQFDQTENVPNNYDSLTLGPKMSIANEIKNMEKMVIDEKLDLNHGHHVATPIIHHNKKQVSCKESTIQENQKETTAANKYLPVPRLSTVNTLSEAQRNLTNNDKRIAHNITDSSKPNIKIIQCGSGRECIASYEQDICMNNTFDITGVPLDHKYQVAKIYSPLIGAIPSATRELYTIETKDVHKIPPKNINSANILDLKASKYKGIMNDNLNKSNNKNQVTQSTNSPIAKFSVIQLPICKRLLGVNTVIYSKTNITGLNINSQVIDSLNAVTSKAQNLSAPEEQLVSVSVSMNNLNEDKTSLLMERPTSSRAKKYSQSIQVTSSNKKYECVANLTEIIPSANITDHFDTANVMDITLADNLRVNTSNSNSKFLDSQNFATEVLNKKPLSSCSTNNNACSEISATYTSCFTSSHMDLGRTLARGDYKQGLQKSHDLGLSSEYAGENSRTADSLEKVDSNKTEYQHVDISFDKECKFPDIINILNKYKTSIAHSSKKRKRSNENTNLRTHTPSKTIHMSKKYGNTNRQFRIQHIPTTSDPKISSLMPKESTKQFTECNLKSHCDFFANEECTSHLSPHHILTLNEHTRKMTDDPVDPLLSQEPDCASLNEDLLNPKFVLSHSTGEDSILSKHSAQFDWPNNGHFSGSKQTNYETNVTSSLKSIYRQNCNQNTDIDEALKNSHSVDNSFTRSVSSMSTKFFRENLRKEIEYGTKTTSFIINDSKISKKHVFISEMASKCPFKEPRAKKLKHYMLKEKDKLSHKKN